MTNLIFLARIALFLFLLIVTSTPLQAATPLIRKSQPWDCYYHYDGKIWVYSNSSYSSVIKTAIKKLNKKFRVFQWTSNKAASDVIITSKKKGKGMYGQTRVDLGKIILYKNNMKKLSRARQVLVVEHELCHAAGLDHAKSKKSLMYKSLMKTKGLTAADLGALKKARKRAKNELLKRKILYQSFISAEKEGTTILIDTSKGKSDVLVFPKRGASYRSSDSSVLKVNRFGLMTVVKKGEATLTVNEGGLIHEFMMKGK